MRTAYLDCSTGIAGDMTLAALIDAGVNAEVIRAGIDSLGLDGVHLRVEKVMKGGFHATYVKVEHPEQHAHRHLADMAAPLPAGRSHRRPSPRAPGVRLPGRRPAGALA